MTKVALRDLVAGVLVALMGAYFFYNAFGYGIGDRTTNQAGLFPMMLGAVTVLVGAAIALLALRKLPDGVLPQLAPIAWRPFGAVVLGIAAFALLIGPAGLIPAVAVSIGVSSLGTVKARLVSTLLLIAGGSIGVWLVFVVGLRVPVHVLGSIW